jgi:hypothetical protein
MNEDHAFKLFAGIIVSLTLLLGMAIAGNILTMIWTGNLIKIAIEKGQNPVYIKCAMETSSSAECKAMMTVIAISKSDK